MPTAASAAPRRATAYTALYYVQARTASQIAGTLDKAGDAAHFAALAAKIAAAFDARFAAGDQYGSGRQVTSILPLAFGMVPADRRDAIAAGLVTTVLGKDRGHLDTGIFGTRYLVDALVAAGRPDVAFGALQKTTYPGYGFQISLGATTAWEEWTYKSSMHTYDHAMFAGINASFLTQFAGIQALAPAYERVRIKPVAVAGLDEAGGVQDTVRGEVRSHWRRSGGRFALDVTVPANATAEVWLPVPRASAVLESGAVAGGADGVVLDRMEDGHAVFDVGSGTYRFTVDPDATSVGGDVGGTVPATLTLSLAGPASFGAFAPGVAPDYSATLAATVTSTAGDATLGVTDPSSKAPGHLVNGSHALAQALRARVGTAAFAPIGAAPLALLSWSGPVGNDPVTVDLSQPVSATDPLRTGTYAKTLTFTLSTTTP
jgi:hypothetical protein